MKISFDDIENAFMYVSSQQQYMNNVFLCKETGQMFYSSDMYDSDDLPEDIDDPDKYLSIPHQNDLELGIPLVFEFAEKYLPEAIDQINSFFQSKGAYSRYKDFLDRKGFLDKWYQFEDEQQTKAIKLWCLENNIKLTG